jgi:hypothetical protein
MGSGFKAPQVLASTRDGRECLASRPGRWTPRETAPSTHFMGYWLLPRADLNGMEKGTFTC